MSRSICQNKSNLMPILKNARHRIFYRAKHMMRRWYRDWESCKQHHLHCTPQHEHNTLSTHDTQGLMAEECRFLLQEQRTLDVLDSTLDGGSIPRVPSFFFCPPPDHSLDFSAQESSLFWSNTLFSRSGCTMRYR